MANRILAVANRILVVANRILAVGRIGSGVVSQRFWAANRAGSG